MSVWIMMISPVVKRPICV